MSFIRRFIPGVVLLGLCPAAAAPTVDLLVSQSFDNLRQGVGHHTGADIGVDANGGDTITVSAPGKVVLVQANDREGCSQVCAGPGHGCSDHGLGNTVIVEHTLEDGSTTFTQYSHLDSIDVELGDCLVEGDVIGVMGGSAYGCPNYWPKHLHYERKDAPVLENPSGAGTHYGYTPNSATGYGFADPLAPIPATGECLE